MQSRLPLATMLLLAAWPFISFLNNNQEDALTYSGSILTYAVVFAGLVVLIALLAVLVLGRGRMAAVAHVLGVGSVLLFSYLPLSSMLSALGISLGSIRIAIWLVISLGVLVAFWRLSRFRATSQVVFAAAAVMALVPAIGLIGFALQGGKSDPAVEQQAVVSGSTASRPNVYWFVFDAYSRADVLQDYFDFDNSKFLTALEERSFRVADDIFANSYADFR